MLLSADTSFVVIVQVDITVPLICLYAALVLEVEEDVPCSPIFIMLRVRREEVCRVTLSMCQTTIATTQHQLVNTVLLGLLYGMVVISKGSSNCLLLTTGVAIYLTSPLFPHIVCTTVV